MARDAPPGPLRLSAAEEDALFPGGMPGPGGRSKGRDAEAGGDALDRKALLDGLADYPFLHGATRLHLALAGAARWTGARLIATTGSYVPLFAAMWIFNSETGTFSTKHMAAYTVSAGLWIGGCLVLGALGLWNMLAARFVAARFVAAPNVDAHPFAVLVRWRRLVTRGSRLVAHVSAEDVQCACPDDACSGSLPGQAAILRGLAPLPPLVTELFANFSLTWTLIFTFGGQLRATPWAATFVALFLVNELLVYSLPTHLVTIYNTPSIAMSRLLGRLRCRALDLMLGDVLARLVARETSSSPPPRPADEPYIALHFALSRAWPAELEHLSLGRAGITTLMGTLLASGAVTAAASSCVPLWIAFLLVTFLAVFTYEMLSVAAANAEIDRAASLYLAYRTRILVLLAGEPSAPVASALQRHADLLDAFARTEEKQGRFLGFRVGYAVVRGFLATVLTVAVGMWSVLRGAGVGFTLETVCPG